MGSFATDGIWLISVDFVFNLNFDYDILIFMIYFAWKSQLFWSYFKNWIMALLWYLIIIWCTCERFGIQITFLFPFVLLLPFSPFVCTILHAVASNIIHGRCFMARKIPTLYETKWRLKNTLVLARKNMWNAKNKLYGFATYFQCKHSHSHTLCLLFHRIKCTKQWNASPNHLMMTMMITSIGIGINRNLPFSIKDRIRRKNNFRLTADLYYT